MWPGAYALFAHDKAAGGLEWLLSLDLPLFVLLSALVSAEVLSRASRRNEHRWLLPAAERRRTRAAFMVADVLHSLRWPAAPVLAGALLAAGAGGHRDALAELLWISLAATAWGASLAALMIRRQPAEPAASPGVNTRVRGLAALSSVPLRETRRQLHLRRLSLLAMPVLLAAPMGVPAGQVALVLTAWLPLLCLVTATREAGRMFVTIRRWVPSLRPLQLHWFAWRFVAMTWLVSGIAMWTAWRVVKP